MYIILFSEKHRRKKEQFWWLLKELRNCNSCIIRTWSLFCSFWIYINLPFCTYSFKKIVSFLPFLPSVLFWFWLWRSPYTLYIIVYIDAKCSVILFRSSRPEVFYKNGVLKKVLKFTGKHLCQSRLFNWKSHFCFFSFYVNYL